MFSSKFYLKHSNVKCAFFPEVLQHNIDKTTEDNLGINKLIHELHSPEEQIRLISYSFITSPIVKGIIMAAKD